MPRFAIYTKDFDILGYFYAPFDSANAFFQCVCDDRQIDPKNVSYEYMPKVSPEKVTKAIYRMAGTLD